jgi:hypothetical protein
MNLAIPTDLTIPDFLKRKGATMKTPQVKALPGMTPLGFKPSTSKPEWKLIDDMTGKALAIGDPVETWRGEAATITAMRPPHKASSSGFVTLKFNDGECEHYAGVINATWKGGLK